MRGKLIGMVFTTMALAAGSAQAAGAPQITDPAGDANGLNTGDTRPASYDPADLLSVAFHTGYVAVPVGEDGIDYQATGLSIAFDTLAPARSDGPTLEFSMLAELDGCSGTFSGFLGGPLTNPGDGRAGTARWSVVTDCAGTLPVRTATSSESERFTTKLDPATGDLVVSYPFDALSAQHAALLKEGTRVTSPRAYSQTSHGADLVGTFGLWADIVTFDWTETGRDFVVGEDMPRDRECTRRCPERKPDRDPDCRPSTSTRDECPRK